MDIIFIFGAKYLFLLVFLIAGIYFLRQPRATQKKMVIFALITIPIIYILATLAAYLYFDPRPFVVGNFLPLIPHVADNGFPSDHVLMVSAIASVVYFFNKKVGLILFGISTLIAISRVYVGVHHFVDVLASMLISIITASLVYTITKHANTKKLS
jgi:undecaprenyl-diphosphatase